MIHRLALPQHPPASNDLYGHWAKRAEVRQDFRNIVQAIALESSIRPLKGSVRVEVAIARDRHDLDSGIKALLDALQGFAYTNDRQVDQLEVVRVPAPWLPSPVLVRVSPAAPLTPQDIADWRSR